jgi:hypothetical protein
MHHLNRLQNSGHAILCWRAAAGLQGRSRGFGLGQGNQRRAVLFSENPCSFRVNPCRKGERDGVGAGPRACPNDAGQPQGLPLRVDGDRLGLMVNDSQWRRANGYSPLPSDLPPFILCFRSPRPGASRGLLGSWLPFWPGACGSGICRGE